MRPALLSSAPSCCHQGPHAFFTQCVPHKDVLTWADRCVCVVSVWWSAQSEQVVTREGGLALFSFLSHSDNRLHIQVNQSVCALFLQVYRMHPLLPDKVEVRDALSTEPIAIKDLSEIIFEKGTAVNTSVPVQDLIYTLGVGHAGGPGVVGVT